MKQAEGRRKRIRRMRRRRNRAGRHKREKRRKMYIKETRQNKNWGQENEELEKAGVVTRRI